MKTRHTATPVVAHHPLWERFGGRLLRFAHEERRLDQDALYELWAESDDRCWVDTEQQAKTATVPGLPPGTETIVADGSAAMLSGAPDSAQADFAESSDYGEDLTRFASEIDTWRQRRTQREGRPAMREPGSPR